MSDNQTREVLVLTDFKDREGAHHEFGETFTVAYQTPRQRQAVNEYVHRGFLTFEIARAKAVKPEPKKRSRGKAAS